MNSASSASNASNSEKDEDANLSCVSCDVRVLSRDEQILTSKLNWEVKYNFNSPLIHEKKFTIWRFTDSIKPPFPPHRWWLRMDLSDYEEKPPGFLDYKFVILSSFIETEKIMHIHSEISFKYIVKDSLNNTKEKYTSAGILYEESRTENITTGSQITKSQITTYSSVTLKIPKSLFCFIIDAELTMKMIPLLEDLFTGGDYYDFTIIIGSEHFRVHKAIIGPESSVFRKLFESNKKIKEYTVEENIRPEIFKILLRAVYERDVLDPLGRLRKTILHPDVIKELEEAASYLHMHKIMNIIHSNTT